MSRHKTSLGVSRLPAAVVTALIGLAALAWFILRTGTKPSRAVYPCQRAALSTSWALLLAPVIPVIPRRLLKQSHGARVAAVIAVAAVAFILWANQGEFGAAGARADWEQSAWLAGLSGGAPRPLHPGRVVQVTDRNATSWDFETGWYGDYVDQDVVTSMVEDGLLALTGAASVGDAWDVLIPDFEPGRTLAIKVNLNNTRSEEPGNAIDAIIEPVNALLPGLIAHGFAPSDITVYDVTHGMHDGHMPERLAGRCAYEGVNFAAFVGEREPYSQELVRFDPANRKSISPRPLARVLVEADYLINMPIAKAHDFAGMSASFKNHFGSIDRCDRLHPYVFQSEETYTADYSPLLELYANEHVGGKTVLTLCDALFGTCAHLWSAPSPWPACAGPPNSILLATDPVALDCVVADLLAAQGAIPENADDYLVLAGKAGMGVYERAVAGPRAAVPTPGSYSSIDYVLLARP